MQPLDDPEEGTVKTKITSDFILDLYAEAKKKRGKNRENAMEVVKALSKRIGDYLIEPIKK